MAYKQPNENSQYRRLRRRTVRRRSKVTVDLRSGGRRKHDASPILDEHLMRGRLIDLSAQAAAVFMKTRLHIGEALALTLTLGNGSPLRMVGEVIALKKVAKQGGYLATISLLCPNHEHRTAINRFLAEIEFLTAQQMRMVL